MTTIIKEAMRIGGKSVTTEETVSVHYPYTDEIVGTVGRIVRETEPELTWLPTHQAGSE